MSSRYQAPRYRLSHNNRPRFTRVGATLASPAVAALLLTISPAQALPQFLDVSLFRAHQPVKSLIVDGPLELLQPTNRHLPPASKYKIDLSGRQIACTALRSGQSEFLRAPDVVASRLLVRSRRGAISVSLAGRSDAPRRYKGTLEIVAAARSLDVTNKVPVRDYVYSVVGSETNPDLPVEALKAQSVLSQTLLARYKRGDQLSDTTETQAYLGDTYARPSVRQAVDDTWGETLTFNGAPTRVYFHATCGGGTSDGEEYFELKRGSYPYLKAQPCTYCRQSPFFQKQQHTIPLPIWEKQLGAIPQIERCNAQERPLKVLINHGAASGYAYWLRVGQRLGWDKMPGTRYKIQRRANSVVLTSNGAGHGVGMCQWGAGGLAALGKTYLEILRFYFPGTSVRESNK